MEKKIIISIFLFMICFNVKAENVCSTDELNKLKELANNVEIIKNLEVDEYYYKGDKNLNSLTYYYNIKISNLLDNFIVFYRVNSNSREMISKERISNIKFFGGNQVVFYIYSLTNDSCSNKILRTINVKFDKYNLYYYVNKDKCLKYYNFKYCKEYMDIGNKTNEEIEEQFAKYLKDNNLNNGNNNLLYIFGGITLICLIVIIVKIVIRKIKKNQL